MGQDIGTTIVKLTGGEGLGYIYMYRSLFVHNRTCTCSFYDFKLTFDLALTSSRSLAPSLNSKKSGTETSTGLHGWFIYARNYRGCFDGQR